MKLQGTRALVTGASMGIGAATARRLAKAGVEVVAVARNEERLRGLSTALPGTAAPITPLAADLLKAEERARVIEQAGDVDILVNNAGLGTMGLVEQMSADEVRHLFELNVIALIDLTQLVLPAMLAREHGHISNIGSVISHFAAPPLTVYAATKFAVEGFTDGLRREVASSGVGVSLIQPGPVRTGFWERAESGDRTDVADKGGVGIPAEWVAAAIERAVRNDHRPGYATVGVPRAVGLGRLADIPTVSWILDQGSRFAPRSIPGMGQRAPSN